MLRVPYNIQLHLNEIDGNDYSMRCMIPKSLAGGPINTSDHTSIHKRTPVSVE